MPEIEIKIQTDISIEPEGKYRQLKSRCGTMSHWVSGNEREISQ
jgi:hypothetical protein